MPVDGSGPEIGQTGARFGGGARRRRRRMPPVLEPVVDTSVRGDGVGFTGARFGGAAARRRRTAQPGPDQPVAIDPGAVVGTPAPGPDQRPAPAAGPEWDRPEPWSSGALVRPYVLTGGRTRSSLALEALITARPTPPRPGEPVERTRIRELCRIPRSVAEVAALLGVPLGVARVLLGDLHAAGAIEVHRTADATDLAVMERVLGGLRRL